MPSRTRRWGCVPRATTPRYSWSSASTGTRWVVPSLYSSRHTASYHTILQLYREPFIKFRSSKLYYILIYITGTRSVRHLCTYSSCHAMIRSTLFAFLFINNLRFKQVHDIRSYTMYYYTEPFTEVRSSIQYIYTSRPSFCTNITNRWHLTGQILKSFRKSYEWHHINTINLWNNFKQRSN